MEVHVVRTHEENFECGLCDYEGKDLEALDIHLKTCETYQCGICSEKLSQLPDIKMHFEEKHETYKNSYYPNGVRHIKPSRENKDVYNNKFHSYSDLFSQPKFKMHIIVKVNSKGPWGRETDLSIR